MYKYNLWQRNVQENFKTLKPGLKPVICTMKWEIFEEFVI